VQNKGSADRWMWLDIYNPVQKRNAYRVSPRGRNVRHMRYPSNLRWKKSVLICFDRSEKQLVVKVPIHFFAFTYLFACWKQATPIGETFVCFSTPRFI